MSDPIRATYQGDGKAFLFGVPRRDVTEDEYQALPPERRAAMDASRLYVVKTDREMAQAARTERRTEKPPAPAVAEEEKE